MKDIGEYRFDKLLGIGSEGMVYRGECIRTGEPCAIKELTMNPERETELLDSVLTEYKLLQSINSPHLVELREVCRTASHLYVVYKLYPQDLLGRLNSGIPLSCAVIRQWTSQILKGLVDMHFYNFVHRDLKPGNILLTEDSDSADAVITDFGVMTSLIQAPAEGFRGTIKYMAPELQDSQTCDTRADVFSLGVLVQCMFDLSESMPDDAADFVAKCLIQSPEDRPTSFELAQHRFIQEALRERLEAREVMVREQLSMIVNPQYDQESEVIFRYGTQDSQVIEKAVGVTQQQIELNAATLMNFLEVLSYCSLIKFDAFRVSLTARMATEVSGAVEFVMTNKDAVPLKYVSIAETASSRIHQLQRESCKHPTEAEVVRLFGQLHKQLFAAPDSFQFEHATRLVRVATELYPKDPQVTHIGNELLRKLDLYKDM